MKGNYYNTKPNDSYLAENAPEVAIENFRTIMNRDDAIKFIDNLAKSLNHYPIPEKPAKVAPVPAKKTKASRAKS